jgi:hypothetical protein
MRLSDASAGSGAHRRLCLKDYYLERLECDMRTMGDYYFDLIPARHRHRAIFLLLAVDTADTADTL